MPTIRYSEGTTADELDSRCDTSFSPDSTPTCGIITRRAVDLPRRDRGSGRTLVKTYRRAAGMRVLREINRGGFGRVEAVELDDGTVVARKVFDPAPEVALATDPDKLVDRFKREVRVQSALPAQFFMPILDYDLDDPSPWYTMPMADRNYKTQIEQDRAGGTVNQEALAQILESLAELHSLGFTHRDLKPENILLHNGRWKLSDFGLVLPPAGNTTTLTSTGSTWGTQLCCARAGPGLPARHGPRGHLQLRLYPARLVLRRVRASRSSVRLARTPSVSSSKNAPRLIRIGGSGPLTPFAVPCSRSSLSRPA